MSRCLAAAVFLFASAPAVAEGDEIGAVPAPVVIAHGYAGDTAPSQIRFINVRMRSVSIIWIAFDGSERPYASLEPGDEIVQPTFVAHRWLVRDKLDNTPLAAFISTRSDMHGRGIAQIALIR